MTAVDHAELKRLAEGARVPEGLYDALTDAWTDFLDANPDDLTSPEDCPDHALVTCDQMIDIVREAFAALRTQAPDSWRPDREAVRKAVLAMEATIVWDKERGYRMPYRVRDPLYEACDALRPQTAESGK